MNLDKPEVDREKDLNILKKSSLDSQFIFVIPFRNQEKKIIRCLLSIINQKNKNNIKFELLLIDDSSTDGSLETVQKFLSKKNVDFTIISNLKRKWKTRNLYNAGHLIRSDESIIIEFDGDDYVPEGVDLLSVLDREYQGGCLKTFGSFEIFSSDGRYSPYFTQLSIDGIPHDTNHIWDNEKCVNWAPLRSYKVKLFKNVPVECFLEKDTNDWLKLGEDEIIHPTMSELAGKERVSFVEDKIYVYDISGDEHDVNFVNHRNYLAFKLLRVPASVLRNDPRKKFKTYDEACKYVEKNKINQTHMLLKITPIFSDFKNDLGFSRWGTGWFTFSDALRIEGCIPTRNYSKIPPVEVVSIKNKKIKAGHLKGFLGVDIKGDMSRPFFMGLQSFFRGFQQETAYDTDFSNNTFIKGLPKEGAKGIKISLMVGMKSDQAYSVNIIRGGVNDFSHFCAQISDRDIPRGHFQEFVLPFPEDNLTGKPHINLSETELFWAQPTWKRNPDSWSRKDFKGIIISPNVRNKEVDLYVKKIEFF